MPSAYLIIVIVLLALILHMHQCGGAQKSHCHQNEQFECSPGYIYSPDDVNCVKLTEASAKKIQLSELTKQAELLKLAGLQPV